MKTFGTTKHNIEYAFRKACRKVVKEYKYRSKNGPFTVRRSYIFLYLVTFEYHLKIMLLHGAKDVSLGSLIYRFMVLDSKIDELMQRVCWVVYSCGDEEKCYYRNKKYYKKPNKYARIKFEAWYKDFKRKHYYSKIQEAGKKLCE